MYLYLNNFKKIGLDALRVIHRKMCNDPEGKLILKDRPIVSNDNIDFEKLRTLPKNTFGSLYLQFLENNKYIYYNINRG